jgi:hypothetical protein
VKTVKHSPVNHLNTSLKTRVEFALAATTSEDLSFDDEFITALNAGYQTKDREGITGRSVLPKFFATSKASCAVFAGTLLGVGMPYYDMGVNKSDVGEVESQTHGI